MKNTIISDVIFLPFFADLNTASFGLLQFGVAKWRERGGAGVEKVRGWEKNWGEMKFIGFFY